MNEMEATLVLVALFALRCVIPLAITFAVAYLMNRLVDRWQAEDELLLREMGEPAVDMEPPTGGKLPAVTIPCWVLRNCDEAMQARCAARKQPGLPCWLVRLRLEGFLPEACSDCPIYAQAKALTLTPSLSGD